MDYKHTSVMPAEVIRGLNIKEDGVYVDGTLGGGGHSKLILQKLSDKGVLIGIDRDLDAITVAEEELREYKARRIFVHDRYSNINEILGDNGIERIDGAILDIGVSSYQLDDEGRGFSYMKDAPLDMRMDKSSKLTAETVVNEYSESELADIIHSYGEERWAQRIAKFIVAARKDGRIESSGKLVELIKAAIPKGARKDGPHPAKRTFQSIRIEVNGELDEIRRGAENFIKVLAPKGRLGVITFHSLEDRIVKRTFAEHEDPCTCPKGFPECVCGKVSDGHRVNRKPLTPGEEELSGNHRARSAKLRFFEKDEE